MNFVIVNISGKHDVDEFVTFFIIFKNIIRKILSRNLKYCHRQPEHKKISKSKK